jgi:hypothetical protein
MPDRHVFEPTAQKEVVMDTGQQRFAILKTWRFTGLILIAVGALTGAILQSDALARQRTATPILPPLPESRDRVHEMEVVRPLYEFVGKHGDIARHLPCFCACGDKFGHESVEQCYISKRAPNGTVTWSAHAMECSICMDVVRIAKRTHENGGSVEQIRAAVEKEYEGFTRRTNTPLPPKSHH